MHNDNYIQSCYLDNRLGVFTALKTAETLKSGIICFSCWEEQSSASVPYLARYIYENYGLRQALISDITWVTDGILPAHGTAISMRDSAIPRRSFVSKIIHIAEQANVKFQLEVEDTGGSDGNILNSSAYPFDWGFVGVPIFNVHTPYERANKQDIVSNLELYKALMNVLG